jgi:hypothetical protein
MLALPALRQIEMRQVEPVIPNRLDRAVEPLGCEATAVVVTGAGRDWFFGTRCIMPPGS